MALPSTARLEHVSPGAMRLCRNHQQADSTLTDEQVLRHSGALRSDGYLTQAARLLLCPSSRICLEFVLFDAHGGSVLNRVVPESDQALLEQLDVIERACSVVNTHLTFPKGFTHETIRQISELAIREAILNGLIHRDWNLSEATQVHWIQADNAAIVRSPGGVHRGDYRRERSQ